MYAAQPGWWLFLLRLGGASILMVSVILILNKDLAQWLSWGWQQRCGYLAMLVVVGVAVYFVTLLASGMRLRDLVSRHGD